MSVWHEGPEQQPKPRQASVSDVHFKIECERLPIDHAFKLSSAIFALAPWLRELPETAVHTVHVAASQNGWERPEMSGENELMLSKRTRLKVRIDNQQADRLISTLCNQTLNIDDRTMTILSGQRRSLLPANTLFSRYACFTESGLHEDNESEFVQAVISGCESFGYSPSKLLCGKGHSVATASGQILCRSVMLADVPAEQSLLLQEKGIGDLRWMGCGILLPHKDTGAVHQMNSSGS